MTNFNPKTPDEEVNYSKEHPLKDFAILVGGLFVIIIALIFILDFSMGHIATFVNLESEVSWFGKSAPKQEDSIEVTELVNELWLPFDEERKITFHPRILPLGEPNAFMTVGGDMTVTNGLLKEMKSLNALGFVLCHELGHFYHRHVIKRMGTNLGISALLKLVGVGSVEDVVSFAAKSFSRKDEAEADAFAVDCVQKRFGHMKDFDSFFQVILKKESLLDKVSFISTHPITTSRINAIGQLAVEKGYSLEGPVLKFRGETGEKDLKKIDK